VAHLELVEGGGRTRRFDLRSVVSLGRGSTNEIQIQTEEASRVHARIFPAGRSFVLEDLRSSNGTFVNGQRVARRILADGDRIRAGGVDLVFRDEAPSDRLEGELLGGAYRILGLLGRGGMGAVYKALQISMDRVVALKILHRDLTRDREFVVQFLNEARTAGQLSHPNIIHVYDFGEHEGMYYFSMEYIEGETLQDVLDREGKFTAERTLDVLIGVARALAHAHGHRVIHRDVKPRNVMLDRVHGGAIKLADLGLAKVIGRERVRQKAGPVMGTPHYMAPEIARGQNADERSDLYALGATAFRMLTSRVPYDGQNSIEVLTKHVRAPVPDPCAFDVTIPPPVAKLVQRLMAKNPSSRPVSAAALIDEIERLRPGLAKSFEQDRARRASSKETMPPRPRPRLAARRRRRSVFWPLAALAMALAAGALAFFVLWQPGGPEDPKVRMQRERAARLREIESLVDAGQYAKALDRIGTFLGRVPADSPEARKAERLRNRCGHGRSAARRKRMEKAFTEVRNFALLHGKNQPEEARRRLDRFLKDWPEGRRTAEARALGDTLKDTSALTPTVTDAEAVRRAHDAWLGARRRASEFENRDELNPAIEAVRAWLEPHPSAADAADAKKYLASLVELREEFLKGLHESAGKAAKAGEWTIANRDASRLITQDPKGPWGQKGTQILDGIRASTEKIYHKAQENAAAKVHALDFTEPVFDLLKVRGELLGTPWVNRINREIEDIRLVEAAHERLRRAIRLSAGNPKTSPFLVKSPMTGTEARRPIVGASADGIRLQVGRAVMTRPWKDLSPGELAAVHRLYPPAGASCLGEGVFFARTSARLKSKTDAALARADAERLLRAATKVEGTAEAAERYLARLTGRLNLRTYAFEDGLDLLDFEMKGGAWDHKDGRLVQSAGGEAEAQLVRGTWPTHELRAAIDVKLRAPEGVFSLELRQDKENSLACILDPEAGCTIFATIRGASLSKRSDWRPKSGGPLKVRLAVRGGKLVLDVNGAERASLEAPGADALDVRAAIHTHNMPCEINRIELLNASE